MKHVIAKSAATLILTPGLAKLFGSLPFAPWATGAPVKVAGWFGAYGVEQVEDFYAGSTLALSLVLAMLAVYLPNRALIRFRRV
jgi:hypothetical protein